MAWFDELDEQAKQQWHARVARKRLDLSASVEETLRDGSVQEDQMPEEIAAPVQNKPGLTRRTTKVRLQVVPKPEETHGTEESTPHLSGAAANRGLPAEEVLEAKKSAVPEPRVEMSGSGTFEIGQSEVAVANVHVAASSVVVVMLADDPGPVVVQYISLQPRTGFTVHLSAPTKNRTPFNYRIF